MKTPLLYYYDAVVH